MWRQLKMFKLCLVVTLLKVAVATPTSKTLKKIIGGQAIDISEAPYQVSLEFKGSFHCGGSIISENVIITAAHCIFQESNPIPDNYKIRAGSSFPERGGEVYPIDKFLKHPEYDTEYMDQDIAVIWLSKPLQFSKNITAIDMMTKGEEIPDGAETIVSGWGLMGDHGPRPTKLQMVKVPKVNDKTCKLMFWPTPITPSMLCAGEQGKSSCKGDSGGPLVYQKKLAGVVSWGFGCGHRLPGVYAKVSALREWLDSVIQL